MIEVTLSIQQEMLFLSVQDDGAGFTEKILQKGMEPFSRDNPNDNQHFGMGLYICRLLSEKHDGSMTIKNTDRGALAVIQLKISKP